MSRFSYPLFRPNIDVNRTLEQLRHVLESGNLTQGNAEATLQAELEQLLAAQLVLTNSCTSALDLAAYLVPIIPNSIVLTTAQTCAATNAVLVHRGAVLAWVDVDPLTGTVSGTTLDRWFEENPSQSVRDRISALVVVDWAGRACDYDSLRAVLERYIPRPTPIIEDAAHAALGSYKQEPIARRGGDFVAFSFQAIKHLSTGDGGALVCRDANHLARARKLKWFGLDRTLPGSRFLQDIDEVGFKYHMNDVAAAIGLANVGDLGSTVDAHRRNARQLWERLLGVPRVELAPFDFDATYWFFPLLSDDPAGLQNALESRGVEASAVHRRNDHMTGFRRCELRARTTFPGLDSFSRRQLNLPCGKWMTPSAIDLVAHVVKEWAHK